MEDVKCNIAFKEVLEILKYISKEEYDKIPKEKIELFEINADKSYEFKYDPNFTLEEQNVSKIAKTIIAILFRDYWATPLQKEKILAKENYDRQKLEKEKAQKYNPDDLFKKTKKQENITTESFAMIEYKESIFKRFINRIKQILHIKNT